MLGLGSLQEAVILEFLNIINLVSEKDSIQTF